MMRVPWNERIQVYLKGIEIILNKFLNFKFLYGEEITNYDIQTAGYNYFAASTPIAEETAIYWPLLLEANSI